MMNDPFQTYSAFGPYSGITNLTGLPYAAMQNSLLNPAVASNPLAATLGLPVPTQGATSSPFGQSPFSGLAGQGAINPQQLQLAALTSQAGISPLPGLWLQSIGLQNPGLQNPLLLAALHNPAIALQNPQVNPILAALFGLGTGQQSGYQPQPFGYQSNSPFAQIGSPYGQPGAFGQQFASPFAQTAQPFNQIGSPYGQSNLPYGQQAGSPFGHIGLPLPPQTWVGQGGPFAGQAFGQSNPLLSQLSMRPFQTPGTSPWGY